MGKAMAFHVHLITYAPSSPQRLNDLARIAIAYDFVKSFIVIKPTGMAAQVGLAEVNKLLYKHGKAFIVLSSIEDLYEIISLNKVIAIINNPEADIIDSILNKDLCSIEIGILVSAGETPIPREELAKCILAKIDPYSSKGVHVPTAIVAIVLDKLGSLCLET